MNSQLELFDLIGIIAHKRYVTAERKLSVLGFNHTEARLLTLLSQNGAVTQDELSAFLTVDRSNAGRSLKKLEAGGYISRRKDASDKRTYIVHITKKGTDAVGQIAKVKESLAKELFRNLNAADVKTIVRLLQSASLDERG